LIPKLLAASGVAVMMSAVGMVAFAAVVDSSGVIHGCYSNAAVNGSHILVVQDTGTVCPKNSTPVDWNQTGPPGTSRCCFYGSWSNWTGRPARTVYSVELLSAGRSEFG
jgi:hypothetical protein